MFRRGLGRVPFVALAAIVLLSIGGYAGYTMGGADGVEGVRYADGFPLFFGFALFFKVLLVFLLVGFIAKIFGFMAWRRGGSPGGRFGHRYDDWHEHHGRGRWERHGDYDVDVAAGDSPTKV